MLYSNHAQKSYHSPNDNIWFEFKSFMTNGSGLEPAIRYYGEPKPYDSKNHFGRCGTKNTVNLSEDDIHFEAFVL